MSSTNNDNFASAFPVWISFIYCSLIAMMRTSRNMLNKSGETGHSCLVPDLRGNAFSFSLLSMLAVGLSHTRLPCPSPNPGASSNSCPSSQQCHPTILCRPLLLLPSIFPGIRVFSSELVLCISWPKN